jgi:hypothetical protein
MADKRITDLQETDQAPDSSYIAIDNGTQTYKITVGNYNRQANATAKQYAEAAQGYATSASSAKDDAVSAKDEATLAVSRASDFANAASTNATAAAGSATEASGYVGQAQTAASNASASATAAETSAGAVESFAQLSKSWAEGNTGVRPDEAVNNAKYWAGVAQGAAGGGVTAFNGRSGVVVPQSGDYNAAMVGFDNTDTGLLSTDTQAAIVETNSKVDDLATNTQAALSDLDDAVDGHDTEITNLQTFVGKKLTAQTLAVGSTTLTFSDASITTDSTIEIYASVYGVAPTAVTVTTGQAVLTFDAQESAVSVYLIVR